MRTFALSRTIAVPFTVAVLSRYARVADRLAIDADRGGAANITCSEVSSRGNSSMKFPVVLVAAAGKEQHAPLKCSARPSRCARQTAGASATAPAGVALRSLS